RTPSRSGSGDERGPRGALASARQQGPSRAHGEASRLLPGRSRAPLGRGDLRALRARCQGTDRARVMKLRLGTRGSRLALAQAGQVADALRARGEEIEIVIIRTSGDRLADVALADFGGKALFVREIEEALLDGRIDAGVHSLKDMPAGLPGGLSLPAYPAREDPRDVLLTRSGGGLD